MQYSQTRASATVQSFVAKNQRRLQEYVEDARAWAVASESVQQEKMSDWAMIEKLASETCSCGGSGCQWWHAADDFFIRNASTIDRGYFASALANVIFHGPGKTSRVPLLVGPTSAAKSMILDPLINVFGFSNIIHRPGEKASMALSNCAKRGKRFIYWDEYRPVEFAARGTVPVGSFLSLFGGGSLEVQVSQTFQNGNSEIQWKRGAAMTAKEDGLWDPVPAIPGLMPVTKEDIKHMQSRLLQFTATVPLPQADLVKVPKCKESFCRWLVVEASGFASRSIPAQPRCLPGKALPALPIADGVGGRRARSLSAAAA